MDQPGGGEGDHDRQLQQPLLGEDQTEYHEHQVDPHREGHEIGRSGFSAFRRSEHFQGLKAEVEDERHQERDDREREQSAYAEPYRDHDQDGVEPDHRLQEAFGRRSGGGQPPSYDRSFDDIAFFHRFLLSSNIVKHEKGGHWATYVCFLFFGHRAGAGKWGLVDSWLRFRDYIVL